MIDYGISCRPYFYHEKGMTGSLLEFKGSVHVQHIQKGHPTLNAS